MQVCFYLLLVLHVAEGCTLKGHGQLEEITAYTGGSALLPCYCTDPQDTPERVTWKKYSKNRDSWQEVSSENSQHRNRVQLVNGHSPGNLSLLILNLTEEDGGYYRCTAKGSPHTDIRLTVKGCTLTNNTITSYITAHTGGSVLLPCSCAELCAKPETFSWKKHINQNWDSKLIERDEYSNRVQLFNGHSPGNLSLLISHLTVEDRGVYMCDAMKSGLTYIRLTVKAATNKPITSSPVNKDLPPPGPTIKSDRTSTVTSTKSSLTTPPKYATSKPEFFIYAAVGGLLLLIILTGIIYWRYRAQRQKQMESCERKTEWRKNQETQNDSEVLYATVNDDKCNKVKETNNCEVLYAAVDKEDKRKKVEENDDVTYSSVVHNKRSKPATVLLDTEATTEYASIKLN
ncbi:uncharacterized protein LOC118803300 [Colossoma macropomum]|uniref:uncharacterized protein LOC118803300 n=1 Tax=Colossoma macropomum TaxID=42526 RepID=UPI00186552D6|nr:uncharacterized protein LOC118803300 [Colossoma macropomum]